MNTNSNHQPADDDTGNCFISSENASKKDKVFQRALAVVNEQIMLTRDKSGTCHVTLTAGSGYETMPLDAPRLAREVKRMVRKATKARPPKTLIAELVEELVDDADSLAIERHEANRRVTLGAQGQYFIDLCNDDREVLVVDAKGYRLHTFTTEIPLFLRTHGMMALPNPIGIMPNLNALRGFLNVSSEDSWRLLVVFLLFSVRPKGPYVIMILIGTAGSSKSTFSRTIRSLIDPSAAATQTITKKPEDLIITATNSHLLVFDNVRELTFEISDMLCCLATGASIRKRKLFTDSDETILHAIKPCLLNGISDIASQPDMVSRCIQLELPTIKVVRTEEEFHRSFEAARPAIFAGMMDALSKTMAALPNITNVPHTRMADFAHFGMAVESALGWEVGSFATAYANNQREQMANLMGDDPLAHAIRTLVTQDVEVGDPLSGTPTELLDALSEIPTHAQLTSAAWPKSPHSLSKRLKKMEPALRACGVGIEFTHSGKRAITLSRLDENTKE